MKTFLETAVGPALALALALSTTSHAEAQAAADAFVRIDSHPYGPGDRDMTLGVKLVGGETSSNTEIWILYSRERAAIASAKVGDKVPQGRAKVASVSADGVVSATFTFPHTDHPKPNATDANQTSINSGATTHYKVVKKRGTSQEASRVVSFAMPDKLTIANFGDSYASGEGAPFASGARWDHEVCHRSSNSGQSRAVKDYRSKHPEVAVAYRNVACSGAQVRDGMTASQSKSTPFWNETLNTRVAPQLDQVEAWLKDNRYEQLNIALVSIGGNDVGFGPWVTEYFLAPNNLMDASKAQARSNIRKNIDEHIPLVYDELKDGFDARFDYDHVLVTEYPDPTRWKDGQNCGRFELYGACWGPVESAASPEQEFEFARESIVQRLNSKISGRVNGYDGWTFLGGAVSESRLHGVCNCDAPYFNTIGASIVNQGDPYGVMHLNRTGHREVYKPVVLEGLTKVIDALRRKYKMEQAKELAKEKASKQLRQARARLTLQRTLLQKPELVRIPPPKIPSELLQQVKPAQATKDTGDDSRMPDDLEE